MVGDSAHARGVFVMLRTDRVRMPDGDVAARDVVEHPGAVAVVALDGAGRVLLIRQYRHPVGALLWELPAGVRDVAGEQPLATAQRELGEEAGYAAGRWHLLAEVYPSPGISSERIQVYLARDLSPLAAPPAGHEPRHEEAYLAATWLALPAAVELVLAGDIHNGVAAVGILAAYAAWQGAFARLRDAGPPGS